MISPSLALQGAMVVKLKATTAVSDLIAQRVYDTVPQNVVFPYVAVSNFQELPDKARCINAVEIFAGFDVYSRQPASAVIGQTEALRIAEAVKAALDEAALTMPSDWRLVEIQWRANRSIKDSATGTVHIVVEFRAMVDAA